MEEAKMLRRNGSSFHLVQTAKRQIMQKNYVGLNPEYNAGSAMNLVTKK